VAGCYDDVVIGDIAMSFDSVLEESIRYGKSFWDRCSLLFVHSVLHLFGLDHVNSADAEVMEDTEVKVLRSFGIVDPHILGTDIEKP
jgi:probable rRNA maturation factor